MTVRRCQRFEHNSTSEVLPLYSKGNEPAGRMLTLTVYDTDKFYMYPKVPFSYNCYANSSTYCTTCQGHHYLTEHLNVSRRQHYILAIAFFNVLLSNYALS